MQNATRWKTRFSFKSLRLKICHSYISLIPPDARLPFARSNASSGAAPMLPSFLLWFRHPSRKRKRMIWNTQPLPCPRASVSWTNATRRATRPDATARLGSGSFRCQEDSDATLRSDRRPTLGSIFGWLKWPPVSACEMGNQSVLRLASQQGSTCRATGYEGENVVFSVSLGVKRTMDRNAWTCVVCSRGISWAA